MRESACPMKYGIMIEEPGVWTGYFGLARGNTYVPWIFDNRDDAQELAAICRRRRLRAVVTVKENPPEMLPWNEKEWRKAIA